jgi:hypothetical protein
LGPPIVEGDEDGDRFEERAGCDADIGVSFEETVGTNCGGAGSSKVCEGCDLISLPGSATGIEPESSATIKLLGHVMESAGDEGSAGGASSAGAGMNSGTATNSGNASSREEEGALNGRKNLVAGDAA